MQACYFSGSGLIAPWLKTIEVLSFVMSPGAKGVKIKFIGHAVVPWVSVGPMKGTDGWCGFFHQARRLRIKAKMRSQERDGLETPARSAGERIVALRLRVLGRVQGVGFRPFVARVAGSCRLTGWVKNTPEGVVAHVEGTPAGVADFRARLRRDAPPAAEIHEVYEQARRALP